MTSINSPFEYSNKVNVWIEKLYVSAKSHDDETFKHWCILSLKSIFDFDSALWATRSDMTKLAPDHWVEDTYLYDQPEEFMANYFKIASKENNPDPLNLYLHNNPDQFFTIWDICPKEQWYSTDYYQEHCKRFKVENAIAALTRPPSYSVVSHAISFYREDQENEFSPADKLLGNILLPNLIEAFRANLLNSFKGGHRESLRAVVDRFGEIIEAEEGFYTTAKDKGLLDGTKLTIPELEDITSSEQLTIEGLCLDIRFSDGTLYIEAFEESLVSKLSTREKEVCRLMLKGFSNKEIAGYLKNIKTGATTLKTNTVNAHLRRIFEILKVSSRAAATAYLARAGID